MANESVNRLEQDRAEIMRLHDTWSRANRGLHFEEIPGVFVGGDRFQGFNLNGHTYFQRDEWVRLWKHLRGVMEIAEVGGENIIKLEIRGDAAYLAYEGTVGVRALESAPNKSSGLTLPTDLMTMRYRGSEFFLREDENGRPVWKIWHVHYSPCAPENEPRPAFAE